MKYENKHEFNFILIYGQPNLNVYWYSQAKYTTLYVMQVWRQLEVSSG